jgi:glycosyltransferase involved in cell wall biosynthesis
MNDNGQRTVAFVLPSLGGGGAERVTLNYLANLDDDRLHMVLISFTASGRQKEAVPPHIEHINLEQPRLRAVIPALFQHLYKLRPDIIYSTIQHTNVAVLALRPFMLWRPKVIIREPNLPSRQLPVLSFSKSLFAAYRILYPQADRVVAPSQQIIAELIQDFRIETACTKTLANPVNVAGIRQMASPVLRESGVGLRLVSAGSLTAQKGFDRLLRSFAAMPADSHLTIMGAGPLMNELQGLAVTLDCRSRVSFAGFVENPWPYFAGADAFLLASKWEGMPNVALEALACGVPVIGSREAGGLGEVAAETGAASVSLAEPGVEMNNAVATVMRNEAMILRPSLLPERFYEGVAAKALAEILTAM